MRRSNSSPEMSSSWKAAVVARDCRAPPDELVTHGPDDLTVDPDEMILLPSCEPTLVYFSMPFSIAVETILFIKNAKYQ